MMSRVYSVISLSIAALVFSGCGGPGPGDSQTADGEKQGQAGAPGTGVVTSPDGEISVTVDAKEGLHYSVTARGESVIERSSLALHLHGAEPLGPKMEISEVGSRSVDETWKPVWGTAREIRDKYNEITISLEEPAEPGRKLALHVRAYDDGVAYRYFVPEQPGLESFLVTREESNFLFPGDPVVEIIAAGSQQDQVYP